ncbi:MAG TPA: pyruvate kinase [Candidatus Saccharimonadales bacterium]|nr:pyruvate kinase [Candidatus Saccharimonadales bacterium]
MEEVKTKIISTIGPATLDYSVFQNLVNAGIDYIRINTSYGDKAQYDLILNNLKKSQKYKNIEVMLDIKKLEVLQYAKTNNIKTIAISFTEHPSQIEDVRKIIDNAFIISKIETEIGVQNFDAILDASDGIMVARGDLGVAVSLEKVPPLQNDFTIKTLEKGKFLITATEMLLSMVNNTKPTRAEVSDVANAVFDHSSAVMLSEETAIGKYPVETVVYMKKIIIEAEKWNQKNSY